MAAAGAPLLAVPSLGGGDAMVDTSVHFLLGMALLSQEVGGGSWRGGEGDAGDNCAADRRVPAGALPALILLVSEEKEKEEEEVPEVTSSSSLLHFFDKVVFVAQRQIPMVVQVPHY